MRSALIHGVLLAVMLVYGYRTWTRDKTVKPNLGSVVLWNKTEADLVSIEFKTEKKTMRVERRGEGAGYWWGTETTIEKKPKPPEKKPDEPAPAQGSGSAGSGSAAAGSGSAAKPAAGSGSAVAAGSGSAAKPAAGSGSGSAVAAGSGSAAKPAVGSGSAGSGSAVAAGSGSGSGAGSGSAAAPPVVMEEIKKTKEFPIGEAGDKIIKGYLEARAIRELGVPSEASKKDYKLVDSKTTLSITFKDGAHTYLVGGSVYGQSDRYVMDQSSGVAYVLSKDIIAGLEIGESSMHLVDPRGFDIAKIETVAIEWNGRTKTGTRITTGEEAQPEKQKKSWADAETKKPDAPLATFIENANNLKPTEYAANLNPSSMQVVLKITYKDAKGELLGTLTLYKREKPGELPEGAELDPANPPKGELEYYVMTEKTHVPALVRKDTAQRSEQDLPIVFGDKAAPIEPKPGANPFGNVPIKPPTRGGSGAGSGGPGSGAPPHGMPPRGSGGGIPGLTPPPGH
jgi:hypothetical protein